MPPKGWKSGRDEMTVIAIRVPDWMLPRIDAHVARLLATQPLLRINRSDATRDLIAQGLDVAEEGDRPQSRPRPPVVPEPAPSAAMAEAQGGPGPGADAPAPRAVPATALGARRKGKRPTAAAAPACPPYDSVKHRLGKLCPSGHQWGTTGQSLRANNKAGYCLACNATLKRDKRQADSPALTGEKAGVITLIRRWHEAEQLGQQALADRLNAQQVPTLSGRGQWQKGTVSKLLKAHP
jgi:hypothetical protein